MIQPKGWLIMMQRRKLTGEPEIGRRSRCLGLTTGQDLVTGQDLAIGQDLDTGLAMDQDLVTGLTTGQDLDTGLDQVTGQDLGMGLFLGTVIDLGLVSLLQVSEWSFQELLQFPQGRL